MTEQRFYCEEDEVTHTGGECPVCLMRDANVKHEVVLSDMLVEASEANHNAEGGLALLMQEADRQRVQ